MSIGSKSINLLMKVLNYKKRLGKRIDNKEDNYSLVKPSEDLFKRFKIKQENYGFNVFIFNPSKDKKGDILYLHGGAYVNESNKRHFEFVSNIVEQTGYRVCYAEYPLAPHHTFNETFEKVYAYYKHFIEGEGNKILCGDSSGGGMAIGLTMRAKEQACKLCDKLILASPWVDATLKNEDFETDDPFLDRECLIRAGKAYAGKGVDVKRYEISPLYGNKENLPAIYICEGMRDILAKDVLLFEKCVKEKGGQIEVVKYEGMIHDFLLFSFEEAKKAREDFTNFILR